MVSYSNEVKHGVLGVPQARLDSRRGVRPVARLWQRGAQALGCDWPGLHRRGRPDRMTGQRGGHHVVAIAAPTAPRPAPHWRRPVRGACAPSRHHAWTRPDGGCPACPWRMTEAGAELCCKIGGWGKNNLPTPCNLSWLYIVGSKIMVVLARVGSAPLFLIDKTPDLPV